ncbi:MAG: hypothetical protein F4039_04415 [Gammaproteobacteria bacterium]|nr:hypothetical protein [Gammaproteobacteria bacterium]
MSTMFGVQKTPIYGSFGEFTVGDNANTVRAKYILTKIKPGNDGTWENELASQMKPWREVFNVEELSFDELLQRELDDSRVAHDLIPYLLGESGNKAKFFPPILAVIVPRKQEGTGIEKFYPTPSIPDEFVEQYGDLFNFEQVVWNGDPTPLATLSYNRQRSAFIIVDGQHRAMAVLALHRQLNENWGDNAFASYYDHIDVTSEQVKNIELPVCIIYFPDLYEDNLLPQEQRIDLSSVCREIFLVVNRSAKRVSEARTLLLDDEDIAARLMRKTLSTLKNRGKREDELARIYSISYADSDTEIGQREVISGRLEYSSAIALHKIHSALSFGLDGAFRLNDYEDISDGRKTRNSNRPAEILLGTKIENYPTLPRNSGKSLPPQEVDEIVEKLGDMADKALMSLFDRFRPFTIHNSELRRLRMLLLEPDFRAQIEQKKVYNLIFDGSGVRNVFESHYERLKEERDKHSHEQQTVPAHLQHQIVFCESVRKALEDHERKFQRLRACEFFKINLNIFDSEDNREDQVELSQNVRKLFQTIATQAFQLGYAMAIFTTVEELKRGQSATTSFLYPERLKLVEFVTDIYLTALNKYFSPKENTIYSKLDGYIKEPRSSVFDAVSSGLRGLLAMSVNEINERQWRFFRYALLEIVHSQFCWDAAREEMKRINDKSALELYKAAIPRLVEGIFSEREKYVNDAIEASVKGREFELLRMRTEAEEQGAGRNPEQIRTTIEKLQNARKENAKKSADSHLEASLIDIEDKESMTRRLSKGL